MDPTPAPPGAPGPSSAPKKMSGCVVALLVVGSVLGLMCLVGGFMFWRATQSETGKRIFSVMGKGIEMAQKGVNAPGAKELREAGCPQAVVLDASAMADIIGELVDAGNPPAERKLDGPIIICSGKAFDQDLPECDDLAAVYVNAAHPTQPFTLSVQTQGNSTPRCSGKYGPDGQLTE